MSTPDPTPAPSPPGRGFFDWARAVMARAQRRLDESQRRFNESQRRRAAAAPEASPAIQYDSAGRPVELEEPATGVSAPDPDAPTASVPAVNAPTAAVPPPAGDAPGTAVPPPAAEPVTSELPLFDDDAPTEGTPTEPPPPALR